MKLAIGKYSITFEVRKQAGITFVGIYEGTVSKRDLKKLHALIVKECLVAYNRRSKINDIKALRRVWPGLGLLEAKYVVEKFGEYTIYPGFPTSHLAESKAADEKNGPLFL